MGLPVARTKVLVYVISGVCAGIAGLLFTAYTAAGYSLNGIGTELDTIASVVIGGTLLGGGSGYVIGSLVGVLVYGVIKVSITFLGADSSWTRITIGVLLLVFVVVQRVLVLAAVVDEPHPERDPSIPRAEGRPRGRAAGPRGGRRPVRFAGDTALADVDFRMFPGEVHSLMGENGAGKSTLIKAITGAIRLDAGSIAVDGKPVSFATPPPRSAPESARSIKRSTCCRTSRSPRTSCSGASRADSASSIGGPCQAQRARRCGRSGSTWTRPRCSSSHSLAVQQLVAIARAVSTELRILILDEPTSSLDQDEVAELFGVIRELKARGVAILFVSHFLEQVYEICDRVTVLRNGSMVGEYLTTELLRIDLVQKMLGRDIAELDRRVAVDDPLPESDRRGRALGVRRRRAHRIRPPRSTSWRARCSAGRPARLGPHRARQDPERRRPHRGGRIRLEGSPPRFSEPREALAVGVAYSSEDRKHEGSSPSSRCARTSCWPSRPSRVGAAHRAGASRRTDGQLDRGARHPAGQRRASGRAALGRQPAEGDAGAVAGGGAPRAGARRAHPGHRCRRQDRGSARDLRPGGNGMSVVFISAELEEVLRVSDRILVLRDRRALPSWTPRPSLSTCCWPSWPRPRRTSDPTVIPRPRP